MPGSSPMLHRYIDQYAAQQDTPSAVTPMTETPRTRLQARLLASKTSSPVVSTPGSPAATNSRKTRGSSVKSSTPRAFSPLVKQNMLAETTPKSITYESKVKNSVEEVVKSLTGRGRAKEGLAVQALYSQSFKDAGTAELLDALLRQRANDRQKKDFSRYVEDISKVGIQSSQIHAVEQGMDENVEVMSEVLPPDYVCPPSPRVVIEVPVQDSSKRIIVTRHTQILAPPSIRQDVSLRDSDRFTTQSATSSTVSPILEQMVDGSTSKKIPRSPVEAAPHSPEALPSPPVRNELPSNAAQVEHGQRPSNDKRYQVNPIAKIRQHNAGFSSGLKKSAPEFHITQTKVRRRRKHKKRMFAAANGPVFSRAFIMP